MGQAQSATDEGAPQEATGYTKTDYYELLGVDRQASEDEIKKAYRRKALELHPDRNYGDVDNATKLFADVQSAYEVLADPQERAWYDSHRDVLLRGGQDGVKTADEFSYNIRMTTADEVSKFMMKFHGRMEFTDSPSGFYGGLQDFFNKLAREEEIACQWEDTDAVEYPEFGCKDDDYEDTVRPFYASWNGFATRKSYSWKDVYRLSEAPDRRIRRLMEKDNKRLREEAVREYNDAVRSLIAFVRKRDPRYQENQKSEAERQQILRDAAAAQKARSRAARQAQLDELDRGAVPEWAKSRPADKHDGGFSSEEDSEEHEFECVVCDKTFKSEAQYEAHERSKKHGKLLKQLKKEMEEAGKDLDLDDPINMPKAKVKEGGSTNAPATRDIDSAAETDQEGKVGDDLALDHDVEIHKESDTTTNGLTGPHNMSSGAGTDDEKESDYAPRSQVEERLQNGRPDDLSSRLKAAVIDDTTETSGTEDSSRPKLGKAKLKRAKKAAQQGAGSTETDDAEFICAVCQTGFPSNTRLFSHIKDQGHAAPIAQMKGKGTKGKKK